MFIILSHLFFFFNLKKIKIYFIYYAEEISIQRELDFLHNLTFLLQFLVIVRLNIHYSYHRRMPYFCKYLTSKLIKINYFVTKNQAKSNEYP